MLMAKLLFCSEKYLPSIGGVQEVTRQLAERFSQRGHQVSVATSLLPNTDPHEIINDVSVHRFAVSGNGARGLKGNVDAYLSFLRSGGFDAILVNAAQQWTLDALLPDTKLDNVFLIPCGFSQLLNPDYASYFETLSTRMPQMAGLIFCSEDYQDIEFARHHSASRLHIIPNGADEREFAGPAQQTARESLNIAPGEVLILSVGTQISTKGHWELLKAYQKSRPTSPSVLVINANSPHKDLKSIAKDTIKNLLSGKIPLPIEASLRGQQRNKRVMIVDLPRGELISLYKSADLFAFASHREYSPLVLFEAMAANLPFISTPAGNAAEIVRETQAGRIVAADKKANGDVVARIDELAIQLGILIDDQGAREQMKAAAIRAFSKKYTWDVISRQYEAVILSATRYS